MRRAFGWSIATVRSRSLLMWLFRVTLTLAALASLQDCDASAAPSLAPALPAVAAPPPTAGSAVATSAAHSASSAAPPAYPPPLPPDPPIVLHGGGKRAVRGDGGLVTTDE